MEQYAKIQQILKKEEGQKERKPIYPPTVIQAVFDAKTGASLEAILAQFNSIYVQYQGTPQATRCIIPKEMRRAGLTITYMNMDSETITERAASAVQKDNDHWGLDINWSRVDELSLSGDISVSAQGTWIINGEDTGVKALGPKGDAGLTPWLKTIDNRLHFSYDNVNWEPCSEPIAAYFRFNATSGNTQSGTIGKIQISRDNKTWNDLSPEFTNNLHIAGYVATTSALPANKPVGTIYGVGPTYATEDTSQTNPIYRLYVYNGITWVDNGQFTSIAAGIVQETGDSETEVMSQKATTEKLTELASQVIPLKDAINYSVLKAAALQAVSTITGYPRTTGVIQLLSSLTSNVLDVSELGSIYISGKCYSDTTGFDNVALVAFSTDPTFATFTHGFIRQPALGQKLVKFEVHVPEHTGTLYACSLNIFTVSSADGYIDVEKLDNTVGNIEDSLNILQELEGNIIAGYPRNNGSIFGDSFRSKVYDVSNIDKIFISGKEDAPNVVLLVAFSTNPTFTTYTHGSVAQPSGISELVDYEVSVPEHVLGQTLYACVPYRTGETGSFIFTKVKYYDAFNAQDVIDEIEEQNERLENLEQEVFSPTKIINCIGDSITQGQNGILNLREGTTSSWNRYPFYLQDYLGNNFVVKNYGYGGNTPADILSAMGWQGVIINQQVILKGDQTPTAINNQNSLTETYSDNIIAGYLSQLRTDEAREAQTKCRVFGIPCNITRTSDVLYIARQEAVSYDDVLPVGTMISMDGVLNKEAVSVIFVGENNINYYNSATFVEYIRNTVSKIQNNKYIIIGLHVAANQLNIIDNIKTANAALRKEFGNRFIDLQKELSSYAIFNALEYTPTDDNYFTQEQLSGGVYSDVSAISLGIQPSSFWRAIKGIANFTTNDSIHMSGLGYQALAYLIYKRIQTLGFV